MDPNTVNLILALATALPGGVQALLEIKDTLLAGNPTPEEAEQRLAARVAEVWGVNRDVQAAQRPTTA